MNKGKSNGYLVIGLMAVLAAWHLWPEAPRSVPEPGREVTGPAKPEKAPQNTPIRAWTKDELLAHLAKSGGKLPGSEALTNSTIPQAVYLSAAEDSKDDRLASQLLDNANPYRNRSYTNLADESVATKEVKAVPDFFPRYQAQLKRMLGSKVLNVQRSGLSLLQRNAWAAPKGALYPAVLALASSKDHAIKAEALECLLKADNRIYDPTNLKLLGKAMEDPNVYVASRAAESFHDTHPNFGPSQNPRDITNPKAKDLAISGLQSRYPLVRSYSAQILDSEEVIDFKLTPLLEDEEPCVRASVAVALAANERALPSGQLTKMIVDCPAEASDVVLKAPKDYQTGTDDASTSFSPSGQSTLLEAYLAAFQQRYPDFNSSSGDPRARAREVQTWWNTPDEEE